MPDDPNNTPRPLLISERVNLAQRYWWVLVAVGTVAGSIASTATQFANYASTNKQTIADLVIARSTALELAAHVDVVAQNQRDIQAGRIGDGEHFQRIEGVLRSLTERADKQRDDMAALRENLAAEHERLGFLYDRAAMATPKLATRKW